MIAKLFEDYSNDIDDVTVAIGGEGGSGNSLTGAITEMGETVNTIIGEPDAEGDGTVIGEFGSMETAVNDVRTSISDGAD